MRALCQRPDVTLPPHDAAPHGPLALVGSGEYLPAMLEVERALIAGRPPRYVQIPTAAAHEGEASLRYWTQLGRAQAERLGVEAVTVVARDRADADDPALAAQLEGAGLVYLSGGNPALLADALRGTLLWEAIVAAWEGGAALAGCSAGAMAMTAWVPRLRPARHGGSEGLALVPGLRVVPHYDVMRHRVPFASWLARPPAGQVLVGIEEETALVGGPVEWEVQGRQSIWLLAPGEKRQLRAGERVAIEDGQARVLTP